MATLTKNLGLTKDAQTDFYNIDKVNENLDKIDIAHGQVNASIADMSYKTASGTANTITMSKQGFTLTEGQYVEFRATANNTGNTTINVNNLGDKSLRNEDGEQLSSGDIEEGKYYKAIWNGSFFVLAPRGGGKIEFDGVVPYLKQGELVGERADMPTGRYNLTSSAVNNKIYFIGGSGGGNKNEEYTPSTNTWKTRANMPTARSDLTSSEVNNKIYCIGGYGGGKNENEEYIPSTNTWRTRADMPTGRSYLTSSEVNNKIYCIGGIGGYSKNEEYNPSTNTWRTRADMPSARYSLTSSAVNNKIYCIGGDSSNKNENEEYNPSTNTWRTRADMPTSRDYLTSSAVNNKIYCIGGHNNGYRNENEEYNPSTNTWRTRADMPTSRGYLTSSAVNNKIYCIGGIGGYSKNEEYNPSTNTWKIETYTYRCGYINKGNSLLLNKASTVNAQTIPANTKTKITSNGYIDLETDSPVTGYIQL